MKMFTLGAGVGVLCMLMILRVDAANEYRVSVEAEQPAIVGEAVETTPEITATQQHYTEADAIALAQMAWGECRGVDSLSIGGREISGMCQKAATMWVACNRFDAGYGDSIAEVVAAPYQFAGYSANNPVDDELLELAYDVLERWNMEQNGSTDVGRVLPADFMWFVGDGLHNHFSNQYQSMLYYTWELPDVYGDAA